MSTAEAEATTNDKPSNGSKILSGEFLAEVAIKQGVSALIAVWLVYSITAQQQQALQRLESAVSQIGLKLDRISDKLTK